MCDDIELATDRARRARRRARRRRSQDEGFGRVAYVRVPGIERLGIYQPSHPSPLRG